MQKLLGPGVKLATAKDQFRVITEHWPSHCAYKALSEEDGLAPVLNVDVDWNDDPPPREELPTTDARGDEPRTRMDMGVLAYYLRASQVVFFECDADLPAGTPTYMKQDKYIGVDVYARPMKGTGLTAVEARRVGLDIMLQLANDLADQAGCKNDTNLPSSVPSITKANWPDYRG